MVKTGYNYIKMYKAVIQTQVYKAKAIFLQTVTTIKQK